MTTVTTTPVAQPGLKPSPAAAPSVPETKPAAAPVPAPADPHAERAAALEAKERAIAAREEKFKNELKKNAAEKNGLGAKLSEYEQLKKYKTEREREDNLARLNPPEFLKGKYGEKWHEVINTTALNGVPPADLIAAELTKVREDFERKLADRDEQAQAARQTALQQEEQGAVSEYATRATAMLGDFSDYPIFAELADAAYVGRMLAERAHQTFRTSGKYLTEKEAADQLEAQLLKVAKRAVASEKYKSQLQGETKPASVSSSSGVQGVQGSARRTLSNHLTASTPGRAPPRSDAEREARAIEAFNAVRAKSQA